MIIQFLGCLSVGIGNPAASLDWKATLFPFLRVTRIGPSWVTGVMPDSVTGDGENLEIRAVTLALVRATSAGDSPSGNRAFRNQGA
jgi:hypothetical protein